jgi:putative SOS response-associated peptidase YedK
VLSLPDRPDAFANPGDHRGKKTRTGLSLEDKPIMAWTGFCRNTTEFGPVYASMMIEANETIPLTNDPKPVLLAPDEYDTWLHDSIQDVIRFQFRPPIAAGRLASEQTDDFWRSGALPPSAQPQGGLS